MQQKMATSLLALTSVVGSLLLTHDVALAREPSPPSRVQDDASTRESGAPQPIAWDCVPNYWWGYWTWAWQPCAWLDPVYVEHTIGAVACASEVTSLPEGAEHP